MNKVIEVGRLTKDPEVRYTDGGASIARFTVASDRKFKKEGEQQTADFIPCIAFGKTAEFIEKWFKKGNKIGIEGRLQSGKYTNKDGNDVFTLDVVVENVEFVEKADGTAEHKGKPSHKDSDGFMSVPEGDADELPFA